MTFQEASNILAKISEDGEWWKLNHGAANRSQMIAAMNQTGTAHSGYRYAFMNEKAKKVISILAEVAGEFNSQHPNDLFSVDDLIDILGTAQFLLSKKTEQ